ncbi:MAG: DUF433 domain-containing protein [Aggregatilineales bacterium]|jgi:uncharacterized protein (DUF433 family)
MTFQEIEKLIPSLTEEEKARLLQRLLQDTLGRSVGIDHTPNVLGGAARIVRTRIPVWTIVQCRLSGMSDREILSNFPVLNAEDIVNAWSYYQRFRSEIDDQIRENEQA